MPITPKDNTKTSCILQKRKKNNKVCKKKQDAQPPKNTMDGLRGPGFKQCKRLARQTSWLHCVKKKASSVSTNLKHMTTRKYKICEHMFVPFYNNNMRLT